MRKPFHRILALRQMLIAIGIGTATLLFDSIGFADDVYYANKLWTGDGNVVENAAVLVIDGKIAAVGQRDQVDIPEGVVVHELGATSLVPGLVIAETTLAERGRDEEEAVTPYIRAMDGFDFFGEYDALLAVGITTVQLSPGSQRIMPGQGAVVKLSGDDPASQTLAETESLRILLTQDAFNPPRIYEPPVGAVSVERPLEPTRPQLAGNLGDAITGLRALFTASQGDAASGDEILESLSLILSSKMPIRITAKSAGELTAAAQLAESYQLPMILVDADQLTSLGDVISLKSEWLRGLVLRTGGQATRLGAYELRDDDSPETAEPWQRFEFVAEAGAIDRLAITASDNDLKDIWFLAAGMLAGDVSKEQLLGCLTGNAARLLGVEQRVGTISVGKDADFVVLSGEPFAAKTQVLATYVDGQRVFNRESRKRVQVIVADGIYAPEGMIKNGMLTVEGKKIRKVGRDVSYPLEAEIVSFPNCVILPGFVDLATQVGTGSTFGDRVNLNDKIGQFLAADDDQVKLARQGGVTTGLLSSSSLPSPVVAFKLGDVPRVLEDPVAIRFSISGNLTGEEAKFQTTLSTAKKYVDSWNEYDTAYEKYKKELAIYEAAKKKYDEAIAEKKKKEEEARKKAEEEAKGTTEKSGDVGKSEDADKPEEIDKPKVDGSDSEEKKTAKVSTDESKGGEAAKSGDDAKSESEKEPTEPKKPEEPKKPRETSALEPYRLLFSGKIPAIVEVNDAKAMDLAVKLFVDDYKLVTILDVAGTGYREAGKLVGKKASVVLHPPLLFEDNGDEINLPERFLSSGIPTAIETRAGTSAKRLSSLIAYTVYRGLGREDAINSLTSVPADLVGLKMVGKLAPKMDADLVVMTGMPFDASSRVVAVMIDGEWVYQDEEMLGGKGSRYDE